MQFRCISHFSLHITLNKLDFNVGQRINTSSFSVFACELTTITNKGNSVK